MSGHILRTRIEQACRDGGFTLGELSVLSSRRDPYRLDTPSMHRDGGWLAEQIARLSLATRLPMHLRGLHYALVAAADCVRPDGLPAAPAALWDSGQDWTAGTRRLVADLAHADAAA